MACECNMGQRSVPGKPVNVCMGPAGGSVTLRNRLMCRTVDPMGIGATRVSGMIVGLVDVVIRRLQAVIFRLWNKMYRSHQPALEVTEMHGP